MVDLIKEQRGLIKSRNEQIEQTRKEIKENEKRIKNQLAEIQKCDQQIQFFDETNAAEMRLRYNLSLKKIFKPFLSAKMREENEFIESDQSMFAKSGGPYDFKATNPQKAEKNLKKVIAMRDQLDGQINHRSMALLVQG